MSLNLIITGVGGQGNVLASQIIGRAAVDRDFNVTIGETFGLSQRGGAVMSHIRISRERNYAPLIPPNMAHIILGLEPLETIRILSEFGNEETIFIVNSRPIQPLNVIAGDVEYPATGKIRSVINDLGGRLFWLDATPLAMELGGPMLLNMVMLGSLCSLGDFPLGVDDIRNSLKHIFPETKLASNYEALEIGAEMILKYED